MRLGQRGDEVLHVVERRDQAARAALRHRVEQEYLEMPGLSLTPAQARRLFGLREDVCARVIEELVRSSFLSKNRQGAYARRDAPPGPRRR